MIVGEHGRPAGRQGHARQLRGPQRQEDGAGLVDARRRAVQARAGRGRRARPCKPVDVGHDDIAFLQYTGGTTGVSKGAVLLHKHVIANVLQNEAWFDPTLAKPGRRAGRSSCARCRCTTSTR